MENSPRHRPDFSHIADWVFDLDNTLYPPSCDLFAQIDLRMRSFICELLCVDEAEAYRLQKLYFREYGTTLAGLMHLHKVKPDRFLDHVHDLDVSVIPENPNLSQALSKIPGRKLVYTNGTAEHAARVLNRIGVADHIDDVFDIVRAEYHPKPKVKSFDLFMQQFGLNPRRAAMFEDLGRNLLPAHNLGMTTVLVRNREGHADPAVRGWGEVVEGAEHIHYHTEDLAEFLSSIEVRSKA
jgi:putative hydrolase of the HAD superfamily